MVHTPDHLTCCTGISNHPTRSQHFKWHFCFREQQYTILDDKNYQFYNPAIFVHGKSADFSGIIWALKNIVPVLKIKCKLSHNTTKYTLYFTFLSFKEFGNNKDS